MSNLEKVPFLLPEKYKWGLRIFQNLEKREQDNVGGKGCKVMVHHYGKEGKPFRCQALRGSPGMTQEYVGIGAGNQEAIRNWGGCLLSLFLGPHNFFSIFFFLSEPVTPSLQTFFFVVIIIMYEAKKGSSGPTAMWPFGLTAHHQLVAVCIFSSTQEKVS